MRGNDLFSGVIIEESLSNKDILKLFNIKETRASRDDNPNTNAGERVWTLHTVEIFRKNIDEVVKLLSENIKLPNWWADLGFEDEIFIIFHNKIFKGYKSDSKFRNQVIRYGRKVKLPEGQIPLL